MILYNHQLEKHFAVLSATRGERGQHMANLTNLPFASINGGMDHAILTGKTPIYSYENGKRTGDTPIGWKISVILPGNSLSALTVKINNPAEPLPDITEEKIMHACSSLKILLVRLIDCTVSLYAIDGLRMTAVANGVELVKGG